MKKKILLILFILMLSGCYNYKELNKIAIVSSIAIDKKDDEYLVSAQVMNVKNDKESDNSNVIVYSAKGKSIEEAIRKMTNESSRELYGGHISKLVVSEEIASEGIINIIDMFQRLTEIKDEFTITISKNIEANKVIKIATSPEEVPADYVKYAVKSADIDAALTHSSKLDEFVSYYLKKGIDPVVSVIEVKNYKEKSKTTENTKETSQDTKIIVDNVAITHNGVLEKFLNENETIGYNFVRNKAKKVLIPIKCDDKHYASISINNSKTKNKVKKVNNKYQIDIDIKSNGMITEYNCSSDLTDEKVILNLQKKTKSKIKSYINKVTNTQKNVKSEFLGFKRTIYLNYPKYKNEDYDINVNVSVNLSRKGELRNSSKGDKNEYKNK